MTAIGKKIELSDIELAMFKRDLSGDFFPPEQTDEEIRALVRVIDKADNLMHELEAYDELGNSLMLWFWKKYCKQEGLNIESYKED